MRTLVWFRGNDLRLGDHAPLAKALKEGEIVPLYVLDLSRVIQSDVKAAAHRLRFLLETLAELELQVSERGSTLLLCAGDPRDVIPRIVAGCGVSQVYTLRQTDPAGRAVADHLERHLPVRFAEFDGETLLPQGSIRNQSGAPYMVFGAFARATAQQIDLGPPIPRPNRLPALPPEVSNWLAKLWNSPTERCEMYRSVAELTERKLPMATDLLQALTRSDKALHRGGESKAVSRLKSFLAGNAHDYSRLRDRADLDGTSRLSADLKFGAVSVRRVWDSVVRSALAEPARTRYLTQLLWREFAHATLWERPNLLEQPFQAKFARFPWKRDEQTFAAWAEGRTGYPFVDAAAHQLRSEGFVHNRARMVAASFLAKDLLVDFRWGERHYLDWLVDGDVAQNDLGWQWSSGTGCDAQPYFRIFNPVTQAIKVDPEGDYVRRYLPHLARLPARHIHAPWLAPKSVLVEAGINLGRDYPAPCVDHASSRKRFLTLAAEHFGKTR